MSEDTHNPSARPPELREGRQYHLGAAPGQVAPLVLLVGDPDRADLAAERLVSREPPIHVRGYRLHTGVYEGHPLSVLCTGMGAGAMEIALVELCQIVAQPVLIRCGSCGALQPDIALGDLILSQGALRLEQASLGYVEAGYPALAHPEAVMALSRAADEQGRVHHLGITATAPGFYGAQGRDVGALGLASAEPELLARLLRQGVLNLEMEASILLTLATRLGLRAGVVCAAFANRSTGAFLDSRGRARATEGCLDVGFAALLELDRMADLRGERPCWHPGLQALPPPKGRTEI